MDRRTDTGDKDSVKRRSYAAKVDDEAQKIAREYRAKRRSLNLDKKTDNSDRSGKLAEFEHPVAPSRVRRKVSLEKKDSEELKVKTDNFDKFNPAGASSPRYSETDASGGSLSPRSSTSPPRPSTKRKAAPPPPCSNTVSTPPPSCPTRIPVLESQTQPNRPPQRKRKESDEKKQALEKEDKQADDPVVYVNVDKVNNEPELETKLEIKTETADGKIDKYTELMPKSNIDDLIVKDLSNLNGETEESLLDTIIKDIPSLRKDQKLEEQNYNTVIVANAKSDLESLPSGKLNGHIEEVIVSSKKKDIECEISPVKTQNTRGKFQPQESTKIEFREVEQEIVQQESDSDNEIVTVHQQKHSNSKDSYEDDNVDGYFDVIKPAAFKRSDDLGFTFQKLISFPDTEKVKDTKDTISIKSDISDASSEAPPLPDSAPPPLPLFDEPALKKVPSDSKITEIVAQTESEPVCAEVSEYFTETDSVPVKASPIMATVVGEPIITTKHEIPSPEESLSPLSPRSPETPGSPISDLPASIFSMRVKSPVRDEEIVSPSRDIGSDIVHIGGKLDVDVGDQRRDIGSDSDMSDDESAEGIFTPGKAFTPKDTENWDTRYNYHNCPENGTF